MDLEDGGSTWWCNFCDEILKLFVIFYIIFENVGKIGQMAQEV